MHETVNEGAVSFFGGVGCGYVKRREKIETKAGPYGGRGRGRKA